MSEVEKLGILTLLGKSIQTDLLQSFALKYFDKNDDKKH